jgi:hypothetical protein
MDKAPVLNPDALQRKIDTYRLEWNSYERLIRKVAAVHTHSARPAA